jgi:hypothetical protein
MRRKALGSLSEWGREMDHASLLRMKTSCLGIGAPLHGLATVGTEKKNLEEQRDDEVEDVVISTLLLSPVLRGRVRIKDRSREQNP